VEDGLVNKAEANPQRGECVQDLVGYPACIPDLDDKRLTFESLLKFAKGIPGFPADS
jgi:hypothetical protein